jgi:hypothetical protein
MPIRISRENPSRPCAHLDFASVKAGAEGQPDLVRRDAKRKRATNPTSGTVERRQDAVSSALHDLSAMLLDHLSCQTVV